MREGFAGKLDDRTRLLLISGAMPDRAVHRDQPALDREDQLAGAGLLVADRSSACSHILARDDGLRRLARGLASSAAILLAAGVAVAIPNLPIAGDLNSWSGWKEAAARVEQAAAAARAEGQEVFVFSPNYKISSLMRFYLPGQPRTYAQDIYGEKALQFDYFPLERDLKGATGILVLSDQDQCELDLQRLEAYFDSVRTGRRDRGDRPSARSPAASRSTAARTTRAIRRRTRGARNA